ncbi:interleukin-13 receptor subunit alpha-1 [Tympanuchus pallidicinctus]|uniref:interleukin-13 receptor subunit alpha-1 n=1 Tax=Tympanuchus pallidicinctus TaxID=109042 RepID=UPI00228711CB|nr:interleukin-13 receptor subunit alpha-1 [Tympanuchus pallidicinctus]
MESRGSFGSPLRYRLLFLAACFAVAAAVVAGEKVLPPPSNLNYSFIQICTLNWTWNPPENISSSCDLEYSSDILIDEVSQHKNEWRKSLFRVTDTVLNKEMRFKVRSECKNSNATNHSQWVETSVPPKGVPGTAAVGLSCVWHNLEYMLCMWHPGENASRDTNYSLFYWFDGLERHKECKNYSVSQGSFECAFSFAFPQAANRYPLISILIRDDSENIMPVCVTENPTTLVKPATPTIAKLSYVNNGIHLQWSESGTIPANCLSYEVRYHKGDLTTAQTIQVKFNSTSIPSVDPNSKYTFQVRAQPKVECYSSKFYSDWSKERSIGENPNSAFHFLLIITIPLIVTVSTIILLVYLKRLKILILPPIPDPREILKRMFGEQNEDPQSYAKEDCMSGYDRLIKEEEIHSLILIETPESSNSEKEHR